MGARVAYELGGYRFEPFDARLVCDGQVIPLTVKATDTLLVLVEHPDTLVAKDDLIAAVWPGVIVEENNLNQQISALRKALSHNGHTVRIETVPKRGYRLVGPVRRIDLTPRAQAAIPTHDVSVRSEEIPAPLQQRPWPRWRLAAVAIVMLVVGTGFVWTNANRWRARQQSEAAYVRGQVLMRQGNTKGAASELQEAIRLDPMNAIAYSALAHALNRYSSETSSAVRPEGQSPSVRAAQRAVEIDPRCATCLGTLGLFLFYHDWQFGAAEARFQEAIRLSPEEAEIRPAYAMLLAVTGRPRQALEQVERGLQVDPHRISWLNIRASAFYFERSYDAAVAAADRALAIASKDRAAWDWRSKALFQLNRGEEAVNAMAQALFPEHSKTLDDAVRAGGVEAGLRTLLRISDDWNARIEHAWRRASWRALLGDAEGALDELERTYVMRRFNAINLAADPVYDGIRCHPRFVTLVTAIGLPEVRRCAVADGPAQ